MGIYQSEAAPLNASSGVASIPFTAATYAAAGKVAFLRFFILISYHEH